MRFAFVLLFPAVTTLHAQVSVRDSVLAVSMIMPSAGFYLPLQDLKQRFGPYASISLGFLRKTKSGWMWGLDGSFLFGQKVSEQSMLKNISTPDSFVIGANGTLYDPKFYMRGFNASAKIGKLFPVIGPNKNSGIYTTLSVGLMQHKIRIDTERNANVPPLAKPYLKGYDQLSNGISFTPAVGFIYLGNKRIVNFFFQLEYSQAFTKNRRSWNFDTAMPDDRLRNDGSIGIRAGWILPLYRKPPDQFYTY
jgi:hypothetical protein